MVDSTEPVKTLFDREPCGTRQAVEVQRVQGPADDFDQPAIREGLNIKCGGPVYRYVWGNDENAAGRFRMQFKNRLCRIAVQKRSTVLVVFLDNGELLNTSLNAIRKAKR